MTKRYYFCTPELIREDLVVGLEYKETLNSVELRKLNRYLYHPKGLRKCSSCKSIFEATSDNFYIKRYYKDSDGNVVNYGLSGNCKSCDSIRQRQDKLKVRKDPELYCSRILPAIKSRANSHKIPFTLSKGDLYEIFLKQNGRCFYTKEILDFTLENEDTSHPHRLMPSVDKLIPELGYVKENIVWCCYYINRMKNDLTFEEFLELCNTVNKNFSQG